VTAVTVEAPTRWTSQTPHIIRNAVEAAEDEMGRALQPGDVSVCCPTELLAGSHPDETVAAWCPGCGTSIPATVETVTS
jgi:hypothetical protein